MVQHNDLEHVLQVKRKWIWVKLIVLQAKRMSTKPAGEKKLSNAEKQKRYREKSKEILKEKDKLRKKKNKSLWRASHYYTRKRWNKSQKKKKKETEKCSKQQHWWGTIGHQYGSLKRATSSLPKDRAQKQAAVWGHYPSNTKKVQTTLSMVKYLPTWDKREKSFFVWWN